jgi:DNA (cytosine-5)-methyltransferase 1
VTAVLARQPALIPDLEREASSFERLRTQLGIADGPGWPDRFGQALRAWSSDSNAKPISTLSLFSGAGGLDIGFHDAGFKIHTMVEIESQYAKTLSENSGEGQSFGVARVACEDIRLFVADDLPETDFIIGGPPCQTFSAAGRRSHGVQGTDDPRGNLFKEYVRLLEELQPRGFLFENVYGIEGAQGGRPWQLIVESFQTAGYTVHFRVLDAADFGVPQHRERLFIVGVRDGDFAFPRPTHGPDSPEALQHFDAKTAIADLDGHPLDCPSSLGGRYGDLLSEIPPGLNYSYFTKKLGHPRPIFAWRSKFSDFLYKADPDAPVRTIKASGGQYTGPFHWDNRPFTLRELKRLQTFPDEYAIVGARQRAIEQIGNSVPPQIGRILGLAVLEDVFGVAPPVDLPRLKRDDKLTFRQLKRSRTASYQEKAKRAIAEMGLANEAAPASSPTRRRYRAVLTAGFDLLQSKDGAIAVSVTVGKTKWAIGVSDGVEGDCPFTLQVHATKQGWDLPVGNVEIRGKRLTPELFIAGWKAFEHELRDRWHKADLVQLNGYYQYAPHLSASARGFDADDTQWRTVSQVVAGVGVRSPSNVATLGFMWGTSPDEVPMLCDFLRSLGYEVRNRGTNPQMREGDFLIPYPFPTLTSASVQLRKTLR